MRAGAGSPAVLAEAVHRVKTARAKPVKTLLEVSVFGVKLTDRASGALLLTFTLPQVLYRLCHSRGRLHHIGTARWTRMTRSR